MDKTKIGGILVETTDVQECFILRGDKTLERITENAPATKGFLGVLNPLVTRDYVEKEGVLTPVDELQDGQKSYEFKEPFIVYMKF